MKSLDQISLTGAYAANRCSKLQNKSKFRGSILGELMDFASSVPDFRRTGKGSIRHRLADIIMLMILGRASGHVGRSEIIAFGRMREFAETYHARLLKGNAGMEIICVDEKAERGTVMENGSSPDIVSAYSPPSGITLATEACHEKSNEIKAVPQLLDKIDVAGKHTVEKRLYVTSLPVAAARLHRAHTLAHREHALGTGRQSSTGQNKTAVE